MDPLHEHMKHGCCDEADRLREENARLKARLVEMYERIIPEEIAKGLERLTRERDDARYDHKLAQDAWRNVVAEAARLEGLILDQYLTMGGTGSTWLEFADEARRIRAQREERCPYCANPIGDGSGGTCTAECHAKGDSCRCAQREEGESRGGSPSGNYAEPSPSADRPQLGSAPTSRATRPGERESSKAHEPDCPCVMCDPMQVREEQQLHAQREEG